MSQVWDNLGGLSKQHFLEEISRLERFNGVSPVNMIGPNTGVAGPAMPPPLNAGINQIAQSVSQGPVGVGSSPESLMRAINMRLRNMLTFDFIMAYKYKRSDSVVVFFVHNDKPGMLEDGWDLFPSDELITKLRLLAG